MVVFNKELKPWCSVQAICDLLLWYSNMPLNYKLLNILTLILRVIACVHLRLLSKKKAILGVVNEHTEIFPI